MEQVGLPLRATPATPAFPAKTTRVFFLDYWRVALVILVVLHHIAIVYGASAPFYYLEPPFTDPLASVALLVFVLFNQAWFMGALFLISGYFTPSSFDRKGPASFLGGRLLRFGIPLVVFVLVLAPVSALGFWAMPTSLTGITSPPTWEAYPSLLGMGPLWFVVLLFLFDAGYSLWRWATKNRTATSNRETSPPSYLGLGIFILLLALASFIVRLAIPLGQDLFGFPSLAYLPEYISFFLVGIFASRRNWLGSLPGSKGVVGFAGAVLASVFLFPLALSGSLFSLDISSSSAFVGHGTWQSAVYALWDALFAVGMTLAVLVVFRRVLNKASRLGTFVSQQSFAVFVIHPPVLVGLGIALQHVLLGPLLKVGLMSVLAIPLCFVLAFLIRKIPGASRIL